MKIRYTRHHALRFGGILLSAGILLGCAEEPTPTDTPVIQGQDYKIVSLCYTGKNTTREALAEMALALCPPDSVQVVVFDHDTFLNNCPLSKKNRITYRCVTQ